MTKRSSQPSVHEVAFDCPHCGAYTTQTWYQVFARPRKDGEVPGIPRPEGYKEIHENPEFDDDQKRRLATTLGKLLQGLVVVEKLDESGYVRDKVYNLHLSRCFACDKVAVWVKDRVTFPVSIQAPLPNPDLPDSVEAD